MWTTDLLPRFPFHGAHDLLRHPGDLIQYARVALVLRGQGLNRRCLLRLRRCLGFGHAPGRGFIGRFLGAGFGGVGRGPASFAGALGGLFGGRRALLGRFGLSQ